MIYPGSKSQQEVPFCISRTEGRFYELRGTNTWITQGALSCNRTSGKYIDGYGKEVLLVRI